MTAYTVVLDNSQAAFLDLNRLMEVLERKSLTVAEAMFDLREILADQVMRHMAVVAGGRSMMRALSPAIVLIPHDMAIHAGGRVIRQVTGAFGIVKRKHAQAEDDASARRDEQSVGSEDCRPFHRNVLNLVIPHCLDGERRGDLLEQMRDAVEPDSLLISRTHDGPGPRGVGRRDDFLAGPQIIVSAVR